MIKNIKMPFSNILQQFRYGKYLFAATNTNIACNHKQMSTSTGVKSKRFVYAKAFKGEPKLSDFQLVEEEVREIKDGEILCQAEYLSVDPYMRPYMERYPVGVTMIGGQVSKIIESKSEKFPVGEYVFGQFGWKTHQVYDTKKNEEKGFRFSDNAYLLPSFKGLPRSLALGLLGMPGNTAYFGFLNICQPKANETVVVSGAAGAVGTAVGQIAKLKGCKVVGIAGSKDKCDWLTSDLGFDHAINYKNENFKTDLKNVVPNGIDCYFDNVGGTISSAVINRMNLFGRIAVCGAITSYNSSPKDWPKVQQLQSIFVFQQLKMEGFLVWRWDDRWLEGIQQMRDWAVEGKIKYHETVVDGFESMPTAFIEMLRGKNFGKAIVKV